MLFENSISDSKTSREEIFLILVENWILLLKAATKGDTGPDFESATKSISCFIESKLAEIKTTSEELNALIIMSKDLQSKAGMK
jgi:hypothetical protein